jgi:hypothetical protein
LQRKSVRSLDQYQIDTIARTKRERTLFSTVTTFGTAATSRSLSLTIESFYPADAETAEALAKGVAELEAT